MRIRLRSSLLLSFLLIFSGLARAASPSGDYPEAQATCKALEERNFPSADLPSEGQAQALFSCQPADLYYGIRSKADYVKARHCAYISLGRDPDSADVLMMVYANGEGLARNVEMARKFVCESDAEPALVVRRLADIDRMLAGRPGAPTRIDMCDYGRIDETCKVISATRQYQLFDQRLTQLQSAWSNAERVSFRELRKKAREFAYLRSDRELDQSVSVANVFAQEEVAVQNDDFLNSVRDFENGKLPAYSGEQLAQLDREMAELIERLQQTGKSRPGRFNVSGMPATQEKWLVYRDAWVQFGGVKYPSVGAHSWKGYLTQKRIVMLKRLLESSSA